jgi:hypothetical protein
MSRRDRRRCAVLMRKVHDEAAGVVEIRIFDSAAIPTEEPARLAAEEWAQCVANSNAPLCLCCDHQWRSLDKPPAAFVTVTPARPDARHLLAMGLCKPCAAHPDRMARIATALKQIWPDVRLLARPHKAPGGVQ